jgi:hypothetical protein
MRDLNQSLGAAVNALLSLFDLSGDASLDGEN